MLLSITFISIIVLNTNLNKPIKFEILDGVDETEIDDVATNDVIVDTGKSTDSPYLEKTDELNEEDHKSETETSNGSIKEEKTYSLIHTSIKNIVNIGEVTIHVGTFRDVNGLVIEIVDSNGKQIYYTPEEQRYYGDCVVRVVDVHVGDLNDDSLEDITIIYTTYLGRGYLGGLEFDRSYVLLQEENSFLFDEKQHALGNEPRVNTLYDNVIFYYEEHLWNDNLYTLEDVEFTSDNEIAKMTYCYPIIKSDNDAFATHTNNVIESFVHGILYDFNQIEDYFTLDMSYEVTRSDRFLSVKFMTDWYVKGSAHPNYILNSLNIDLEVGTITNLLNMGRFSDNEINDLLDHCNGVNYAGMFEDQINDDLRSRIVEDWFPYNTYMSDEELFIAIPTNHASGSYLVLSFNLDDVSDYIRDIGI